MDDQALWLVDTTIAYTLQRSDGVNDIWTVRADGSGAPVRMVSEAGSPRPLTARVSGVCAICQRRAAFSAWK